MARKQRIHLPGAFFHVILKGNNDQTLFFNDNDRKKFLTLVEEGIKRFGHRIHCFCLMSNHIHLLVQSCERSIAKGIQNLTFRYAQYYNNNHERKGHVFHGRYKSKIVTNSFYLRELIRYIHCNPVNAGLVTNPETYLWSSHSAYMGLNAFPWLCQDVILSKFDIYQNLARVRLHRFVTMEAEHFTPREDFDPGKKLPTDDFIRKIYKANFDYKRVRIG